MRLSKLFKKTLLVFIIFFGIIASTVSVFSAYILYNRLLSEYEGKALSIAKSISSSSLEVLLNKDATAIQSLIDQFMDIEGVSYVFYVTQDQEIIAHTFVPAIPQEIKDKFLSHDPAEDVPQVSSITIPGKGSFFCVASPVLSGTAGYIHIGMSKERIQGYIWQTIFKLQIITLIIFLVCATAAYFLINRISQPLNELTTYAQKLADHDFTSEIDIHTNDEIGILAENMKAMGKELSSLIQGLEQAVLNATTELQNTLNYVTIILNNIADGLIVTDGQGKILQHNPQIPRMFGISSKNITSWNIRPLFDHTIREIIDLATAGGKETPTMQDPARGKNGSYRGIEFTAKRTDGTTFPVELSISSVKTEEETNYIAIVRDITNRKKVEEELQRAHEILEQKVQERTRELSRANESLRVEVLDRKRAEDALASEKELLTTTLRSIGDGVITTDIEGNINLMNKVAEKLTGWEQEQAQDMPLKDVFHAVRTISDRTPYNPLLSDSLKNNGYKYTREHDLLLLNREGDYIHISLNTSPIVDKESNIIGAVLVFRDITYQKKLEEEHLKSEKLTSVGILAGGIAHDFNNILTAVLNNISLARLYAKPETEMFKNLRQAEAATIRAQKLTIQLLTFSKGGVPIKEIASIYDLIQESVNFALRGSNVRCDFTIDENIWPVEVDHGQIVQVIDNLIINAVQAMPSGGVITMRVENISDLGLEKIPLPQGNYIKLIIQDQGVGIPEDQLEQIFDPYFTTKDTGSGLGLATTYSIIQNHNGFVDVESKPGRGTTFTIYLPALPGKSLPRKETREDTIHQGKGRVLVMDDEDSLRETLADALQFIGYDAEFAVNGEEALAKYAQSREEKNPFDLVIMDLTIPGGMGGKEAIGKLLKMDPDARAIVSSGYSQDPVMADYKKYGFIGVLLKPYTIEEFSKKLHSLITPS